MQPAETGGAQTDPAQAARDLRHSGDLEAAAREFLRVARRTEGADAQVYQLHAAETYLQAEMLEPAREILSEFAQEQASADLKAWAGLLDARAALLEGAPQRALEAVDAAARLDQNRARERDIHELRARILIELNRPLQAINEYILIEPALGDESEIAANRQAIWDVARAIPPAELESQLEAAPPNIRAWMELALIMQTAEPGSTALAAQFQQWRRKYPAHPAEAIFTAQYPDLAAAPSLPTAPARIALLLPLEGQAAAAATAVRDGFIAAWFADGRTEKPIVDVYNATVANAPQAYDQAIAGDAELVIGPLEKGAVEKVLSREQLPLPVLALNQVATKAETGAAVVQFSLSPEDEAAQVAERAHADGRSRALIMTPDNNWGARVFRAFKERWEALGGVVVDSVTYGSETNDFAAPVREILDIDGSDQRNAALQKVGNRDLTPAPHPRADADFLFLAAYSLQARQIQPQLLFFGARALPVYSTSHVYLGAPDVRRDADLNGIIFGDMPGIVTSTAGGEMRALLDPSVQNEGSYLRLFAMGVDAYRMVPQLAALRDDPDRRFAGATGELSINADGAVRRGLSWARFVDGVPTPIESATATP